MGPRSTVGFFFQNMSFFKNELNYMKLYFTSYITQPYKKKKKLNLIIFILNFHMHNKNFQLEYPKNK